MKTKTYIIITGLIFLSGVTYPVFPQDETIISPYIQLQYFKDSDDLKSLKTTLTYSLERMEIPLAGMSISFYSGNAGRELLGIASTDDKGVARLELPQDQDLPVDNDGLWTFRTEFSGNDTIEAVVSDLSIKDVKLDMVLSEADSVKTITITAFTPGNDGDIPVSEEVVMIYVPRMFSLLPVGEAWLDENGSASLEFPKDLPGDPEGNLTIIAKFEEHETFGNVERASLQKWGIPSINPAPIAHRALWTKTPPMWMIITLSILLTGVWGHYLFAIISLIIIKRESKKQKEL
jgi:hypothetical protein